MASKYPCYMLYVNYVSYVVKPICTTSLRPFDDQ